MSIYEVILKAEIIMMESNAIFKSVIASWIDLLGLIQYKTQCCLKHYRSLHWIGALMPITQVLSRLIAMHLRSSTTLYCYILNGICCCNVLVQTTPLGFEPGLITHSESRASTLTNSAKGWVVTLHMFLYHYQSCFSQGWYVSQLTADDSIWYMFHF